MIERFLKQAQFASLEDFRKNFRLKVPRNFNFAYDVMDVWAAEQPDKPALVWANDKGRSTQYTFADLKRLSDRAASYFRFLGIGKGDMVMLMLKRRYEWWICMLALHKIGAIAIPATHLLTSLDIVYRIERARIRAIVCAGEPYILDHIIKAVDLSHNSDIRTLWAYGNELKELDVTNQPKLMSLDVALNDDIEALDLTHNPELAELVAYTTSIETLDLTHNPELMILDVKNDMLDSLKDGSAVKKLQAEVTGLKALVDDQKKEIRNLKKTIKELKEE